jgi:hypothetical protein
MGLFQHPAWALQKTLEYLGDTRQRCRSAAQDDASRRFFKATGLPEPFT